MLGNEKLGSLSSTKIKARYHNASSAVSDVLLKEPEMRQLLQNAGFAEISIYDDHGQYLCLPTKP